MKLGVIGSRTVTENAYPLLLENLPDNVTEIISGGAAGADQLAEQLAREKHLPMRVFSPDYSDGLGKLAPLRRNTKIVENADLILVFWDGVSHGSQHVVSEAMRLGKPVQLIRVPPELLSSQSAT